MRKRTGNIQSRGENSYRIRYVNADGIRQQETIQGTREDAERELAIRLGELAAGIPVSSKPNTVTFGELADDVVTDYEVNGYTSVDDIETRFRLHIIPAFGKRKAVQITTAQIKSYILLRQKEDAANGTINRELEAMRHAFKLAIQGRKLLYMPHVPMLREDNVRTGFLTSEEVDRLSSHLKPPLDSFVRFAFLTGWRYSEIQGLLWRNVDMGHKEIRLDVGSDKNRKGRVFPMSEELWAMLDGLKKAALKSNPLLAGPVFRLRGKPIGSFRKQWASACHKAGLPCTVHLKKDAAGKVVIGTQRGAKGKPLIDKIDAHRTIHDLRRSFAREMDRQGVRQGAIMKLGGWKTDSVFKRYNIVSDSDLRDAIDKIDHARPTTKDGNTSLKGRPKRLDTKT